GVHVLSSNGGPALGTLAHGPRWRPREGFSTWWPRRGVPRVSGSPVLTGRSRTRYLVPARNRVLGLRRSRPRCSAIRPERVRPPSLSGFRTVVLLTQD